jgi:hypothetical protein
VSWHFLDICSRSLILFSKKKVSKSFKNNENRKGDTVDNIFVLHSLIAMYFSFGKKLFCSFVDFKSAFDTVWRLGLWQKLQKSNIVPHFT